MILPQALANFQMHWCLMPFIAWLLSLWHDACLSTGELAFEIWREELIEPVKERLVSVLLSCIQADRQDSGRVAPVETVQGVIDSFVEVCGYKKKNTFLVSLNVSSFTQYKNWDRYWSGNNWPYFFIGEKLYWQTSCIKLLVTNCFFMCVATNIWNLVNYQLLSGHWC